MPAAAGAEAGRERVHVLQEHRRVLEELQEPEGGGHRDPHGERHGEMARQVEPERLLEEDGEEAHEEGAQDEEERPAKEIPGLPFPALAARQAGRPS